METWKEIKGYEGLYECSTHGRVRTVPHTIICRNGWVCLYKDGIRRFWLIHRLIALTFVSNPEGKPFVNHLSGVKTANLPQNLEWVTRKENVSHAFSTGLISHAGEKNSRSKLTAERVALIRSECPPGTRCTRALALKYGISQRRLYDVIRGLCWKAA